jgi:hypothetical protein
MKKYLFFLFLFVSLNAAAQSASTSFTVDDFPVSDQLLKDNRKKINIDVTIPDEFVFIKNTTLKQTLAFELYTDLHRYKTYLFYNNEISYELLKLFYFPLTKGKYQTIKERKALFEKISSHAGEINTKYFTSHKGIKLGDSKEKILRLYPAGYTEHESESCNGDCEILQWKFTGELLDEKENLPVAQNSFGHEVTMIFENDKLTVLVLTNEIP